MEQRPEKPMATPGWARSWTAAGWARSWTAACL